MLSIDSMETAATPLTTDPASIDLEWWRRGIVYQIYPRSFADSNDDGIGDLPGIIAHLDHLNDGTPASLGVDAIWLSPIHPSPGRDVGYDISDYLAIDPIFGSLEDFDRLVAEAHRRGIKVVLDLVMNHTSYLHPWFVESRSSRDNPKADWYLWRDPAGRDLRGRPKPPNNWASFFGGRAWTWDHRRGQFYMHTFLPEQPDLNWRHPEVRAAMLEMVRFWLERGVDGFRLDVFNAFFKHPDMPSNPRRWARNLRRYERQNHLYDKDQPEMAELLAEFRAILDAQAGRMSVGELFYGGPAMAIRYAAPRHLIFDFTLMQTPWRADAFSRAIDERETVFGPTGWPTLVLSNHDQPRHAGRFARGGARDAIAKVAAALLLTLRGTPFLYYGEEIALGNVPIPRREIVDPPAKRWWPLPIWWNRDQCRAPMPWSDGPSGGFTRGRPWMRMAPDNSIRNVTHQSADPRSVLSFYRELIWLRKTLPALQTGSYRRLVRQPREALAYLRSTPEQNVLVALNFTGSPVRLWLDEPLPAAEWRPRLSTHGSDGASGVVAGRLDLRPNEALILVADQT